MIVHNPTMAAFFEYFSMQQKMDSVFTLFSYYSSAITSAKLYI